MVAIILAALGERLRVGIVDARTEEPRPFSPSFVTPSRRR
ncbi:hypothetical protein ASAP_1791 [Asaia bogorensis]|uniref:Uncharacterized protein n=1 Tax=Asaia bogorensis TaxID=91915 RepID=A0A060QKE0_9PROT|nr:hypothetical protein ASAP_1791 [Asaia bogorensis]